MFGGSQSELIVCYWNEGLQMWLNEVCACLRLWIETVKGLHDLVLHNYITTFSSVLWCLRSRSLLPQKTLWERIKEKGKSMSFPLQSFSKLFHQSEVGVLLPVEEARYLPSRNVDRLVDWEDAYYCTCHYPFLPDDASTFVKSTNIARNESSLFFKNAKTPRTRSLDVFEVWLLSTWGTNIGCFLLSFHHADLGESRG